MALAEHLAELDDTIEDPDQVIVVRAVHRDPDLHEFQSRYEATTYPAEWLWGPGTAADALAWLETQQPQPDTADYLDRVFAVRHDTDLYLPMRPEIAAALPPDERAGSWFIVRADYPNDAFVHVRNRITTQTCRGNGQCKTCAADLLRAGTYDDVADLLIQYAGNAPTLPPLVRAAFAFDHKHAIA